MASSSSSAQEQTIERIPFMYAIYLYGQIMYLTKDDLDFERVRLLQSYQTNVEKIKTLPPLGFAGEQAKEMDRLTKTYKRAYLEAAANANRCFARETEASTALAFFQTECQRFPDFACSRYIHKLCALATTLRIAHQPFIVLQDMVASAHAQLGEAYGDVVERANTDLALNNSEVVRLTSDFNLRSQHFEHAKFRLTETTNGYIDAIKALFGVELSERHRLENEQIAILNEWRVLSYTSNCPFGHKYIESCALCVFINQELVSHLNVLVMEGAPSSTPAAKRPRHS